MSKRFLVLEVKVVELDENHNNVSTLCQHQEYYMGEYDLQRQDELLQCAYEGFDRARTLFYGLPKDE